MKTTVIEQQNNLKKKRIVSLTGLKKNRVIFTFQEQLNSTVII